MNLKQIRDGIQKAESNPDFQQFIGKPHSTLIYGESKSGKTQLAATLANLDFFQRVIFLAPEKGVVDTLMSMADEGRLTESALEKIIVIDIIDTRQNPNGFETCIKFFSMPKTKHKICYRHGVISCGECLKAKAEFLELAYSELTVRDLLVVDSLSQLGDSAMNTIIKSQAVTYKPLLDDYGGQGKMIRDLLGIIQAQEYCHIICITHVDLIEDDMGKKKFYPLCGTSKMSPNVAKYFGTVIVTQVDATKKKHKASSSTTFSAMFQAGTRTSVALENAPDADLKYLYEGRLIPGERYDLSTKPTVTKATTNDTSTSSNEAAKQSLEERLANLRK